MVYRYGDDISISIHPQAQTGFALLGRILTDPQNSVEFLLGEGQTLIIDNTRVLHGRTGFLRASQRRLLGLWCDGSVCAISLGFAPPSRNVQKLDASG